MPVPVIELQRRLTIVGKIRAGGEKKPNRPGEKLKAWRITSQTKALLEQAAALYGGDVKEWEGPNGREWQVYTEAAELPALLLPGYSLRQSYELWEGVTKRLRLCDGIDEELTGGQCICNQEGIDKCDLYSRLVVALPELDTVLGWQVITKGQSAGHELPTMMALVEATAPDRPFVPIRLRLDQRRGVKDGKVVRFVVPTVDLDGGYPALGAPGNGTRELPRGHTPTARREPTVEEALASAALPAPTKVGGRRAADFGADPDDDLWDTPLAEPGEVVSGTNARNVQVEFTPEPEPIDKDRARRLDRLVGPLREQGHIQTEDLYTAVARMRATTSRELIEAVDGRDVIDEEIVHWSPLRDALTRPEADELAAWLGELRERTRGSVQGELPEGY